MSCAVRIPIMYTIIFMADRPDDHEDMEIEEGAWAEVPPDVYRWDDGADAPELVLCQSIADPKHYRLYKHERDVDRAEFEPTGMTYGGFYTRPMWEKFTGSWSSIKAFHEIPDDPPGAMEEALRYIREAR